MTVELVGKGKSLEEALAKLKDRREAARTQLETLKAAKEAITFSAPSLSNLASSQRQQFEQLVRQQLASRGRAVPKGLTAPPSVAVGCTLTAEWPLKADQPEEWLLAVQSIQEKVEAADLSGSKEVQKLSPEEEEIAEEMATMMRDSGGDPTQLGKPVFFYVASLPDADRAKALADAFSKAKAQAAELAQAAGMRLGPLVGLSGQGSGQRDFSEEMSMPDYGGRSNYVQQMMARQAMRADPTGQYEALATTPDALSFHFLVQAAFRLEGPGGSP